MPSQTEIALSILESSEGAVALGKFTDAGIRNEALRRLVERGDAVRPAAGFYALPGRIDPLDADWVAFALQVPDGVVGLLSAATHYDMTQELVAYPQAFAPRKRGGGRIRLGGDSGVVFDVVSSRNPLHLSEGVETIVLSATPIRITSRERTLVDLFLFSQFHSGATAASARIPEESFLDALDRAGHDPAFSFDRFHEIARAFGVDGQIRPLTKTWRRSAAPSPGR